MVGWPNVSCGRCEMVGSPCDRGPIVHIMDAANEAYNVFLAPPLFAIVWAGRTLHMLERRAEGKAFRWSSLWWRRLEWLQFSGRPIHSVGVLWEYGVPTSWLTLRWEKQKLGGQEYCTARISCLVPASQHVWAAELVARFGCDVVSRMPADWHPPAVQHDSRGRSVMPRRWGVAAGGGLDWERRLLQWLWGFYSHEVKLPGGKRP